MAACTLAELAQQVHEGKIKPQDWTWCVDENPVKVPEHPDFVWRVCIFVMGTGSGQCREMVVLGEGVTLAEAKIIVHETFGVERVLLGLG